jgi:uncharacterized protein YdhG (YjbR/CyaY superfamily)
MNASSGGVEVDRYLEDLPIDEREALKDLREAIKEAAPEAEECLSYKIPTYKYKGPLVHFNAGKKHLSFITTTRTVIEDFEEDLEDYMVSGTTIKFTADHPLPKDLVMRIVRAKLREVDEKYRK